MLNARPDANQWSKTIIAFDSPHRLCEMSASGTEFLERQEVSVAQQKFKIRLASNDERRSSASLLIEKMYSWRGYVPNASLEDVPNRITLLTFSESAMIGTLTLGLDSPLGMMVDDMYKDRIDELRQAGRRICEITKLAVDQNVKSKRVLAALFHISFIYGFKIHGGTDFLIEVNPRHAPFYRRMLGFEIFGDEKICPRVSAPAVLLRLDLEHANRKIREVGGKLEAVTGEKSLYPYFFSKRDELGIANRLLRGE